MKHLLSTIFVISLVSAKFAVAGTPIQVLKMAHGSLDEATIIENIKTNFNVDQYRLVRAQVISKNGQPDHLLVYLHSKKYHKLEVASVPLGSNFGFVSVERNHEVSASDLLATSTPKAGDVACPDTTTQFIAIAPNDDTFEQGIAKAVAAAANKAGLKTVELYGKDATGAAWMNYMSCPNLKGNFYDGDSNPSEIAVANGVLSSSQLQSGLTGAFRFDVTNIWVACEAYNNPMLDVVQQDMQAKKYAAGINDLEVGPSDNAAQCAMIADINGQYMTDAWASCIKQNDQTQDQWGWGGTGSDLF